MTSAIPFKSPDEYVAQRSCLVAVDSDGSALDTMDVKYRRCFIPKVIEHFDLAGVAQAATQVAEFVFLQSKYRGLDRFRALIRILDLLTDHPEVRAAGFAPPVLEAYRAWVDSAEAVNEPNLAAVAARATGDAGSELDRVLRWSRAIDAATQARAGEAPPFPGVREALAQAAGVADVVVISSAPTDVVRSGWRRHDIDRHARMLCGLEFGPKADLLKLLLGRHYAGGKVLMIGDAPGDLRAARASGVWFYPIIPGREQESWQRFRGEILVRFVAGTYTEELEGRARMEFDAALPAETPWTKEGAA